MFQVGYQLKLLNVTLCSSVRYSLHKIRHKLLSSSCTL